ncbi:MAG: DinB family protein, partial [Spirochaetes bacterium]|nr:DinB family protein [Spirochaetota bacterium]
MKNLTIHDFNEKLKLFRTQIKSKSDQEKNKALATCLELHQLVHAKKVSGYTEITYDDHLWDGLSEEKIRFLPKNDLFSIAWHYWHIARIEDITINILIKDDEQLLFKDEWYGNLGIKARDTGNLMTYQEMTQLTNAISISALREYRIAVGKNTQKIIQQLTIEDLRTKVKQKRLDRLLSEGAVLEEAKSLIEYWGKKTITGLLAMPATRHNLVHLNASL